MQKQNKDAAKPRQWVNNEHTPTWREVAKESYVLKPGGHVSNKSCTRTVSRRRCSRISSTDTFLVQVPVLSLNLVCGDIDVVASVYP